MLGPLRSVLEAFHNSFYKDFFRDMYVGDVDAGTGFALVISPALFFPLSLFSDSTVAYIIANYRK